MERKIGEIFEYKGEWYQCVECDSCGKCSLRTTECGSGTKSDLADEVFGECSKIRRSDSKHVIFKKLEKVGEPYKFGRKLMQKYNIYAKPYLSDDYGYIYIPGRYNEVISIEIKQNKEDMEEKKLNLKPFDLEAAKAGKPVCTRDGRKARIICFDAKDNLPIIALITNARGDESLARYKSNGRFINLNESDCDLMMLPEKKEGWAKVRKDINLYETKEEADRKMIGNDEYVTAKVFWEE